MSWRAIGGPEQQRAAAERSRALAHVAYLAAVVAVSQTINETLQNSARPPGPRQSKSQARLRKLAVYTAVCGFDVFASHVAQHAGVTRRLASRWVSQVEAWRDEPGGEDLLDNLIATARRHIDLRMAS